MSSGAERVERKLVAILCADVADYSRLTHADEIGTMPGRSLPIAGFWAAYIAANCYNAAALAPKAMNSRRLTQSPRRHGREAWAGW
jgi:hypothetical protein